MMKAFNTLPWIPPAEYKKISEIYMKYGIFRKLKKNTFLKNSGDKNKLFYLKKGLCMGFVDYQPEKSVLLTLLPPGRAIGDLTCISGEAVNMRIVVKEDSELLALPKDILKNQIKENCEIALLIAKTMIAKRESHLEGMLANCTLCVEERLKTFFKVLITSYLVPNEGGWHRLPVRLNNEELASIVNATRVSVSRILTAWSEKNHYKKTNSKNILIHARQLESVYDWHDLVPIPDKLSCY